jgi:hypothetical protein
MAKKQSTKRQTTQWPKHKVQKDKQHSGQETKYKKTDNTMAKTQSTKGQITQWLKHKVQKDRQHNDQNTKYKRTNNITPKQHLLSNKANVLYYYIYYFIIRLSGYRLQYKRRYLIESAQHVSGITLTSSGDAQSQTIGKSNKIKSLLISLTVVMV